MKNLFANFRPNSICFWLTELIKIRLDMLIRSAPWSCACAVLLFLLALAFREQLRVPLLFFAGLALLGAASFLVIICTGVFARPGQPRPLGRTLIIIQLLTAHAHGARKIITATEEQPDGGRLFVFKSQAEDGSWPHISWHPEFLRAAIIEDLMQMSGLPNDDRFPKEGLMQERLDDGRILKWRVVIKNAEGDCELTAEN